MKILWMTWKDREHPQAGGAEVVNEELALRLVQDGHEVTFLVSGFRGAAGSVVEREGRGLGLAARSALLEATDPARASGLTESNKFFKIIRVGGRFSVYWKAFRYYKKHLQDWPDLVIDEVNTVPFFARLYVKQKNILFVHQLAREIWFYEMFFPLSWVGYVAEPIYLRLLASAGRKAFPFLQGDRGRAGKALRPAHETNLSVVTVSESSKNDLLRFGFKAEEVAVISEGIELEPLASLVPFDFKLLTLESSPTILSLGALRPMKRTLHIVEAFELLKQKVPNATLVIAGATDGSYGAKVLSHIARSPYKADIKVMGRVSKEEKITLLQTCHLVLVTSLKEGWGLVVTEANSQGTPAVVYNADGLRDSVRHDSTGLVCQTNTPETLAKNIESLLANPEDYQKMREAAWQWSKEITFDESYREFRACI